MPTPVTLPRIGNTYVTQDGDMLDLICLKHYGRWSLDVFRAVWNRNRWLLAIHAVLPPGKIIILPAISLAREALTVELWKDSPNFTRGNIVRHNLFTFLPAEEYGGFTLEEYLEDYRRNKNNFTEGRSVQLIQASQPTNGFLINDSNEVYRYSPQIGFIGVDRFQLTATDGELEDTDIIEIVVRAGYGVARYEIFGPTDTVTEKTYLMFCAVKRLHIDSLQMFITRANDGGVTESHNPTVPLSLAEVTIHKRLTNGSVVAWGDVKMLANGVRTAPIVSVNGDYLEPGECLMAKVNMVKGSVYGLFADVYSSVVE